MIKFEHSVFALPFALTGALLAWRDAGFRPPGPLAKARLDRGLHGRRALRRHGVQSRARRRYRRDAIRAPACAICPPGCSRARFAWGFIVVWSLVFLFRRARIEPACLKLAPVALAIVMFYSFTKRFTSLSHVVLGFSLGIAPAARLDRHARLARPAHSLAHRRRHAVDRRLRHHLRLPGLRLRRRSRPVQHPAALRNRRSAVDFARCCTWECSFACWCWCMLFALGRTRLGRHRRRRRPAAVGAPPGPAPTTFPASTPPSSP